MEHNEIIRLVRLHLTTDDDGKIFGIEAYTAAVERASIEECAKVCEQIATKHRKSYKAGGRVFYAGMRDGAEECSRAFRALLEGS